MSDALPEAATEPRGMISSKISTAAVQVLSEYTGRGPTKAHTIINRDSVTIVLRDTLTKGERRLVEAGREDEVLRTRHAYQEVMRSDLIALVEREVGRKVIAFMSDNHVDPDIGVEFFLLDAPAASDGAGPAAQTAAASSDGARPAAQTD
jgi:uncharacterized protein YbcI